MNVRQVVPRDAIPSIDDPVFGTEYFGEPDDEMIVVERDGDARAYPVRILNYHEIVNDEFRDEPIAVTWCPLCGSAVVYERTVGTRDLTFGVSGKLADDALVMYDRETESEWKQSLGECIAGELEGTTLSVSPASMMPWTTFRDRYPNGVVLQRTDAKSEAASETDEPESIDYDARPYERYFQSEGFGLGAHRGSEGRSWDRDDLDAKTVVLGIKTGDNAVGFPLPWVKENGGVVTTTIGGSDVVVFASENGIYAFRNPGYEFEQTEYGAYEADGTTWDEATGESADGRSLEEVPAKRLFAFAWQDDHGPDAFYSA
ncbi:DUF3179 domain-containing protein [Halorussus aquaticus]|uniref:DUF3179 domain-containing protein n=1 Tax=Halorussus aquaticus TaxID=2953748 RepID=A0ABD5Q931_9EURY|nr:DUF3179 domain-containing protein [Halorussus aquaticus]